MLWANMALHEAPEPQALIAQWHHALKVGGFLMFSCLGPDTPRELRRGLPGARVGPPRAHQFTDMHDWGDMLRPENRLCRTGDGHGAHHADLTRRRHACLQELRELEAQPHPARFAALRGRAWRPRLLEAMARLCRASPTGGLALTFEVIYGHALKARPRIKVSALSAVSMQDMQTMLQKTRRTSP